MATDASLPAQAGSQQQPLARRPVLIASFSDVRWLDGAALLSDSARHLNRATALQQARQTPPVVCHLPTILRRLRCERFAAFDVLELFAFVRPASFCLPTPRGLAEAMGLPTAWIGGGKSGARRDDTGDLLILRRIAGALLDELATITKGRRRLLGLAHYLTRAGWSWGPDVLSVLGGTDVLSPEEMALRARTMSIPGIAVWDDLPEWSETAPEPQGDSWPVDAAEIRQFLGELLKDGAEQRPQQIDYAPRWRRLSRPGWNRITPTKCWPKLARASARPWVI
jgi:ATP-dependent DNA helicase DinG